VTHKVYGVADQTQKKKTSHSRRIEQKTYTAKSEGYLAETRQSLPILGSSATSLVEGC
jgi:hypothetical protein